jgi:hypothetical protein
MVKKYRKLPVVIEAVEWTGNNLREVIDFVGLHPFAEKWTWEEYEKVVKTDGLKIFTLEGSHMATIGDFIIKGVHGEPYPCKPDIFAKTYEDADAESAQAAKYRACVEALNADSMRPTEVRKIMEREGFVIDNLDDRWQKFAFTLYTMLAESASEAGSALAGLEG